MKWPLAGLLALAVLGAACSNDNEPTTPAAPTPISPVTETVKASMAQNGTMSRTFRALQTGNVSVTYVSTEPASAVVLGLGIGIRAATDSECLYSRTVNTAPGSTPQLTVPVDVGLYCAGVYDIGNVGSNGLTVSLTITHP